MGVRVLHLSLLSAELHPADNDGALRDICNHGYQSYSGICARANAASHVFTQCHVAACPGEEQDDGVHPGR